MRIVNLLTQDAAYDRGSQPGKAQVKHVNHALHELKRVVQEEGFKSVALTRLATGVGGLDWETEVKPLVYDVLSDIGVPVYVYTVFHAGETAEEPGLA